MKSKKLTKAQVQSRLLNSRALSGFLSGGLFGDIGGLKKGLGEDEEYIQKGREGGATTLVASFQPDPMELLEAISLGTKTGKSPRRRDVYTARALGIVVSGSIERDRPGKWKAGGGNVLRG